MCVSGLVGGGVRVRACLYVCIFTHVNTLGGERSWKSSCDNRKVDRIWRNYIPLSLIFRPYFLPICLSASLSPSLHMHPPSLPPSVAVFKGLVLQLMQSVCLDCVHLVIGFAPDKRQIKKI